MGDGIGNNLGQPKAEWNPLVWICAVSWRALRMGFVVPRY